ncbi:MAG: PQQ-binding-like beta-propeller repeat protein [Acidimicrobiia bacterium]
MRRIATVLAAVLVSIAVAPVSADAAQDGRLLAAFSWVSGDRQWVAHPTNPNGGFQVVGGTSSTVVAVQGRCFWDDDAKYRKGSSTLVGFDAGTGKERWRVEDVGTGSGIGVPTLGTLPPWVGSTPLSTLPITSRDGTRLIGVSSRDGSRAWTVPLRGLRSVAGDRAAFVLSTGPIGTSDSEPAPAVAQVELLDARSGKAVWSTSVGNDSAIEGAALTGASVALLVRTSGASENRLVLLSRRSGKVLSDVALSEYTAMARDVRAYGDTLGAAGGVLVVSTGRTTLAVDGRDGNALRHRDDYLQSGSRSASRKDGTPVVFLAHWVFGNDTHPDRSEAIDGRSGETLWTLPGGQYVISSSRDQTLTMPGNLWHSFGTGSVVNSATGAVRWTAELSSDQSIVATPRSLVVGGGCPTTLRD